MPSFEVLPPTPPTTSSRALKHSGIQHEGQPAEDHGISPASQPSSSGGQTKKRVGFTSSNNVQTATPSTGHFTTVKALPASRDCQVAMKSILKQPNELDNNIPNYDGGNDGELSLLEELENTGQQLALNDKTVRVDAYSNVARALKAYDEFPDGQDTRAKVTTILKCIRRDILVCNDGGRQPADINLVTSALKVAVILIWNRQSSSYMSDDFRIFLVDRAIQVITEHKSAKSVIMHYLHLLATQNFRPGIINNNNRAYRLLESLRALTEYVKGNGVVTERLLVYQKLLDQARPLMKSKANLWVSEVLSSMVSNVNDTKVKATSLAMRVTTIFPASSTISAAVRLALEAEIEEKRPLNMILTRKLEKMIVVKEEAIHVPKIWAVVILLCNDTEGRIDAWTGLKDWLRVIQRCFNCSETSIRTQANLAWNRFVYAARPHEASEHFASMLGKPVLAQLERKSIEKASKQHSVTAMSSYCNLLYYAFRPAASHKQLSRMWNEYIVKVVKRSFLEGGTANNDLACRVLIALFSNAQGSTRVWKEYRAHENTPVEPEELPVIDCRWVRSKATAICQIFDLLFEHGSWRPHPVSDQSFIVTAWRHFLRAIKESSSKEIKSSSETKDAITAVVQLLTNNVDHDLALKYDRPDLGGCQKSATRDFAFEVATEELGLSAITEFLETRQDPSDLLCYDYLLSSVLEAMRNETPRRSGLSILQLYVRLLDLLNNVSEDIIGNNEWPVQSLDLVDRIFTAEMQIMTSFERLSPFLNKVFKISFTKTAWSATQEDSKVSFTHEGVIQLNHAFSTIISALGRLAPDAIKLLDDLLAAIFSCSHRTVVNGMINMWNSTHGQQPHLEYGPKLLEAFNKLRAHVNLELPGFPCGSDCPETETPPSFVDTQDDILICHSVDALVTGPSEQRMQSVGPMSTGSVIKTASAARKALEVPPTHEKEGAPRRTVRHDDSQVHFVPITSSPMVEAGRDSQSLTTRQREVRDRQREGLDFAFADLTTTPVPSKIVANADCSIGRKALMLAERPSTPVLPTLQETDDVELPSPTPRARHYALAVDDNVPLTSSPLAQDDTARNSDVATGRRSKEPEAKDIVMSESTHENIVRLPVTVSVVHPSESSEELPVAPLGIPQASNQTNHGETVNATVEGSRFINEEEPQRLLQTTVTSVEDDDTRTSSGLDNEPSHNDQCVDEDDLLLHGDDLELMTASQLSNELNMSVAEGEQTSRDASFIQDEGAEPEDPKRKRKHTAHVSQSNKRRRRTSTQQQRPEPSVEVEDHEVWDTIIVDTSQESSTLEEEEFSQQQGFTVDISTAAPVQKRGRGRPRKSKRSGMQGRQAHIKVEDEEAVSETNMHELPTTEQSSEYEIAMEANVITTAVDDAEEVANHIGEVSAKSSTTNQPAAESGIAAPDPVQPASGVAPKAGSVGILASLQDVLDRLKSYEEAKEVDLRAVDELCFQIRFQAQVLAKGR